MAGAVVSFGDLAASSECSGSPRREDHLELGPVAQGPRSERRRRCHDLRRRVVGRLVVAGHRHGRDHVLEDRARDEGEQLGVAVDVAVERRGVSPISCATARIETSSPSRSNRRDTSTISSNVAWRWRSRRVGTAVMGSLLWSKGLGWLSRRVNHEPLAEPLTS